MDAYDNPVVDAERLVAAGRPVEAAANLLVLLGAGHGGLAARLVLARALLAAGETEPALTAAQETARMYPEAAEAALGYGAVLLEADALPAAIGELQRSLRIAPDLDEARFLLGKAWLSAGEAVRAIAIFDDIADDRAGLAEARAQAEALSTAPRSPACYVRHLFDQFSADYDHRMIEQLRYRAPGILRQLFGMIAPGGDGLAVLDLGCGTGLSGAAFRDLALRLDGIDLSPRMLDKAKSRGIYDTLTLADVETPIRHGGYDLVLAADTLVYLGDLGRIFDAVSEALKVDGWFLFTAERADVDGFELGPKRRWRHAEAYLRHAAEASGFIVAGFLDCVPRVEKGVDVPGYAVALRREMQFSHKNNRV